MKQEQIISISGPNIYTNGGRRIAIGNADHKVGNWVWVDSGCVFGHSVPHANPYVPSTDPECILELSVSENAMIIREINKKGELVELDRAVLKFTITNKYNYFVYNATSLFFVGVYSGILRSYKKITALGEVDTIINTEPHGYETFNVSRMYVNNDNNLFCNTSRNRYTSRIHTIGKNNYPYVDDLYLDVTTYENEQFSINTLSLSIFGDLCSGFNSVYDFYNGTPITYALSMVINNQPSIYDYIYAVAFKSQPYQRFSYYTPGSRYDLDIGIYADYHLERVITDAIGLSNRVHTNLKSNDGLVTIPIINNNPLALASSELTRSPYTQPTLNVGKKHMILTDSYAGDSSYRRKRFVIKGNEIMWQDINCISNANIDNPIITKSKAKALLNLLK